MSWIIHRRERPGRKANNYSLWFFLFFVFVYLVWFGLVWFLQLDIWTRMEPDHWKCPTLYTTDKSAPDCTPSGSYRSLEAPWDAFSSTPTFFPGFQDLTSQKVQEPAVVIALCDWLQKKASDGKKKFWKICYLVSLALHKREWLGRTADSYSLLLLLFFLFFFVAEHLDKDGTRPLKTVWELSSLYRPVKSAPGCTPSRSYRTLESPYNAPVPTINFLPSSSRHVPTRSGGTSPGDCSHHVSAGLLPQSALDYSKTWWQTSSVMSRALHSRTRTQKQRWLLHCCFSYVLQLDIWTQIESDHQTHLFSHCRCLPGQISHPQIVVPLGPAGFWKLPTVLLPPSWQRTRVGYLFFSTLDIWSWQDPDQQTLLPSSSQTDFNTLQDR